MYEITAVITEDGRGVATPHESSVPTVAEACAEVLFAFADFPDVTLAVTVLRTDD